MPVPENEEPSKSLPVALQSLFYRVGSEAVKYGD